MSQSPTTNRAKSLYFAQPYRPEAIGFYFTTLAEYENRVAANRDAFGQPIEEYELEAIHGPRWALFEALGTNQATIADWFDLLDAFDHDEDRYAVALYLAHEGYRIDELSCHWNGYKVYRGTAEQYAREMYDDCFDRPEWMIRYLDFDRLGRDMVLGGDITELAPELLVIG
ncbi:MAG: hypothetical protein ACE360_04145 [Hyphomicrobiales bacterium]